MLLDDMDPSYIWRKTSFLNVKRNALFKMFQSEFVIVGYTLSEVRSGMENKLFLNFDIFTCTLTFKTS